MNKDWLCSTSVLSIYDMVFPLVPAPEKPVVDMDTVITTPNSISFSWSLPPGTTASEVSWTLAGSRAGGTVDSTEGGSSGMITGNSYTITDLSSGTSYEITMISPLYFQRKICCSNYYVSNPGAFKVF